MPQYLENNICKFTPLFKIDYSKKIKIVSTVFFKMKDSGYKPFSRYMMGIKYLANTIKKLLPDFVLRLFIDDTIYRDSNIMDYLNNIKDIQLVHYSCQNFIANGFHRGTFGTLVRFFPMFDFKNNDADHVIITDIDWHNDRNVENRMRIIRTYNNLKKNKKLNNLHVFIDSSFTHMGKLYTYLKKLKMIAPMIIAAEILSTVKTNHKILETYLLELDKTNKICSNYSQDIDYLCKKSKNKKFVFGIDEYFLNNVFIQYLEENKLEFGIRIHFTMTNIIYYKLFKNYDTNKLSDELSEKDKIILKKFFNYILKDIDNYEFTNLRDAFMLMDKYTYIQNLHKKLTTKQIIIYRRIIDFFKQIKKNNIKIFDEHKFDFILNEMQKRVSFDEYRFFFSNKTPIILEEFILP
jgi:hypothetical protein